MNNFHVIIPARYQSTRLPAKALCLIGEDPMIVHVCRQASLSGAKSITVATDNEEILSAVNKAGYSGVITKSEHPSGSDRVYEAACIAELAPDDIIVNVQGDEPFIPPDNINLVAKMLNDTGSAMSTLCCRINDANEVLDPNAVKVVYNKMNKALYFSRAAIPYVRGKTVKPGVKLPGNYYRHIGIYAYRKEFLNQFINWEMSQHEVEESLEQLRVLDNGYDIGIACLSEAPPHGIDTPEDLKNARKYFAALK